VVVVGPGVDGFVGLAGVVGPGFDVGFEGFVVVVSGAAKAAEGATKPAISARTSATAPRRHPCIALALGISAPHLQTIPGFPVASSNKSARSDAFED
jgi:hypothetical protein